MPHRSWLWAAALSAGLAPAAGVALGASATIPWSACLVQAPEWYRGAEAIRVADNVLLYQHDNGGWSKNVDMAAVLTNAERERIRREAWEGEATLDNGATHTQVTYLARVYRGARLERHREALLRGLDYLLDAQYPNGGWPQYYPLRKGYYSRITFNDNAIIGVMTLLRDVARKSPDYQCVDDARRKRAEAAVARGIQCILKCQVRVNGALTAWCAQHDERTFVAAPARSYELPSLSGAESVGVLRFLMEIERPGVEVVRAVEAGVAWLAAVKITGLRVERKPAPGTPKGYDRIVVADAAAPPLWARFYEIGTNRPFFCGRDGKVKYRLAEIEYERRNGYAWYGNWAHTLLERDYPAWKEQRGAPGGDGT